MTPLFSKHEALTFAQQGIAEQIRALEEQGGPLPAPAVPLAESTAQPWTFPLWLQKRNRALAQAPEVARALQRAPHLYRRLLGLLLVLAALAGGLASAQTLGQADGQLNLFRVLGVLLGLNSLSLVLWLVLTLATPRGQPGLIAALLNGACDLWIARLRGPSHTASHAWLQHRMAQARWRLGWVTHCAWIAYLLGGLIGLSLLLSTRQFDFVWESTLLGGNTFVWLTQQLAAPLAHLGLTVPQEAQILASQLHTRLPLDEAAQTRRTWGLFLLSCLVVYGLLPRLLCALICHLLTLRGERRHRLDLSLPYYIRLQRHVWPHSGGSRITDPDPMPPGAAPLSSSSASAIPAPIPARALWLGLELPPQAEVTLNVIDGDSLARAEALLRGHPGPLALRVDGRKAADRGLLRHLRQLTQNRPAAECWLVLDSPEPLPDARLQGWRQAAHGLGLQPERVQVRINTGTPS